MHLQTPLVLNHYQRPLIAQPYSGFLPLPVTPPVYWSAPFNQVLYPLSSDHANFSSYHVHFLIVLVVFFSIEFPYFHNRQCVCVSGLPRISHACLTPTIPANIYYRKRLPTLPLTTINQILPDCLKCWIF